MNDERFLKDWLQDSTNTSTHPGAAADKVVAQLPETRQRSRWRPLWPARRTPATDPTPDTTGRTRSMLSPISAIAAGALAFALGGALLITQPLSQPASHPGAEGTGTPVLVEVTGTSSPGGCSGTAEVTSTGSGYQSIGRSCNPTWEFSDPRLNGKATNWTNLYSYAQEGDTVNIESWALVIENDEGAWRLRPTARVAFGGSSAEPLWPQIWLLDGEGDYDGLTAVLIVDNYEPHGYIIDGDLPPAPEIASLKQ